MARRRFIALSPLVVGFGFFGLLAFFVTDAHAGCPPPTGYRYIGGSCYFTKGVELDVQVNHVSSGNNPKQLSADITPTGGQAILFCKNKAGAQPPGQKIILVNLPNLSCSTGTITSVVSNQNGGIANVVCTAVIPRCTPTACEPVDLSDFDVFCSSGQFAADVLPTDFFSDVTYSSTTGTIEKARHICTLPNPDALTWDRTTDKPQKKAYDCTGPFTVPAP